MSKFVCKFCGMSYPIYKHVGPHIGEWCGFCQKWIRWIPKKELNENVTEKEHQITIDELEELNKHRRDYEEGLNDEVPW